MKSKVFVLQFIACLFFGNVYAGNTEKSINLFGQDIKNLSVEVPEPALPSSDKASAAQARPGLSCGERALYSTDNSGSSIKILKSGDGVYKTEITVNGVKEAGEITSTADAFLLTSGDTRISLNAGNGTQQAEISGNYREARHAAALSAVSLTMMSERLYAAMSRKADFPTLKSVRYEQVSVSCSQASSGSDYAEDEGRVMQTSGHDIYVCIFRTTYHCNYLSCRETNPHTSPGICQCNASCYKTGTENTGSCSWQPKE